MSDNSALFDEIERIAHEAQARNEQASPSSELPDGVSIQVECVPALNYALAHARVPIIRKLLVGNGTPDRLTDLTLALAIRCETHDGVVASHTSQLPALDPGQGVAFSDLVLAPDPGVLARIEEAVAATICLTVTRAGVVLASLEQPIRILGYSEFFNQTGMQELVAAHVLPNHPAIVPILNEAGAILQAETGDSGLGGYQGGKERAIQIGAAIYESLRRREIGYINPPASFEETGQKIRTPDQVIEQRLGTCLDLACTYAASLEQAGLHPVVYFIKGHAYAGFFTEDEVALTSASMPEQDAAVNLQDIGVVVPVETVGFTSGARLPFAEAVSKGRTHLQQQEVFEALVDVRRARREGVLPLPARVMGEAGLTVIVQQVESPRPVAAETAPPVPVVNRAGKVDRTPPRMRRWKAGLLDLSLRNPLLNLKGGRQTLDVLVPSAGLGRLEDLLMQGHALQLRAHDALTELHRARGARTAAEVEPEVRVDLLTSEHLVFVGADEDSLRTRCKALRDKARVAEEENGTSILHLTIGSLHWTDPKTERKVRSPVLLMPVRLQTAGRGKPMELVADPVGGTSHNYCLLHKLKTTFNLEVPELEQPETDDAGVNVSGALDALRRRIADQGLEMRVDEDAALALLHFGKFRMWKDLDDHWERFLDHPVIKHLVERPGETFADSATLPTPADLERSTAFCPIPCDGAQLEAILAAANGASFVLEGPPGTGKSQTITNLIANALAEGRRVLFVAEKRAALNVVKARLEAIGLAPFCLDIHGKASSPKELRQQLLASLDHHISVDFDHWDEQRRELASRAERLRVYARALHEPGPLGLSAWAARQRLLQLGPGPTLPVPAGMELAPDRLKAAFAALHELPEVARACSWSPNHAWSILPSGDPISRVDRGRLREAVECLQAAHERVDALDPASKKLVQGARSLKELGLLHRMLVAVEGLPVGGPVSAFIRASATPQGTQAAAGAITLLDRLLAAARPVRERFADSIFGADISGVRRDLDLAARGCFLVRGRRVRRAAAPLKAHLRREEASPPLELLPLLDLATRCARDADAVVGAAAGAMGPLLAAGWSPWNPAAGQEAQRAAAALAAVAPLMMGGGSSELNDWLVAGPPAAPAADVVGQLVKAWAGFLAELGLSEERLVEWSAGDGLSVRFAAHGPAWVADADQGRFLELRRWGAFLDTLSRASAGCPALRTEVMAGRLVPDQAEEAFARSLARAALAERLAQPVLAEFDGLEHGRQVRAFADLQDLDTALLRDVVPARLLGTRPFKAGQRYGEVAELARQELLRQRGGLSVRALVKKYARAVSQLAPCFLMSPDSVSQFIEPGALEFDLVVFDEASQVPVGDAIGAIARGKSVVVVGDSRQMPPTSFFSGGADSADAPPEMVLQDAPEDLDSILSECVGSGLARVWLSWHYRSKAESLIAFSNTHYYDGRLASFPAPHQAAIGCGVRWQKVEGGVFDRGGTRTNRMEAEAVAEEIQRRLRDPATSRFSIGVVTFNVEQQELIASLLEERSAADPVLDAALKSDEPDNRLFVKNLENVQGDERDVILLSVSFARDSTGRMTMNFGPLNRPGGERRWNVAITRARREVVVFSSIEPEDIQVERVGVGATGVRHLRAYLELARDGMSRVGALTAPQLDPDLHREEIAAVLRQEGLQVETDVGLSSFRIDLAVSDPKQPGTNLLAILLDGPAYLGRRTVQDRDGLPVAVLEHLMQWPATMRIWLPEWLAERRRVVERVLDRVRQAQARPGANTADAGAAAASIPPGPPPQSQPLASHGPETILKMITVTPVRGPLGSRLLETPAAPAPVYVTPLVQPASTAPRDPEDQDFTAYISPRDLGSKEDLEAALTGGRAQLIRSALADVLAVEGPVEAARLARIVVRRFGLSRVRTERIHQILRFVPASQRRRSRLGQFVWRPDVPPEEWRAFRRTPPDCERPLDEVAPEEVRNAMVYFTTRGMSISDEALFEEVASVFDVQRLTAALRTRLVHVLEWVVTSGALRREADRLLPPHP